MHIIARIKTLTNAFQTEMHECLSKSKYSPTKCRVNERTVCEICHWSYWRTCNEWNYKESSRSNHRCWWQRFFGELQSVSFSFRLKMAWTYERNVRVIFVFVYMCFHFHIAVWEWMRRERGHQPLFENWKKLSICISKNLRNFLE